MQYTPKSEKSTLKAQKHRATALVAQPHVFTSNRDVITSIVRQQGVKGLFKGFVATMLRELPCFAVQFGAYEYSKRTLTQFVADRQRRSAQHTDTGQVIATTPVKQIHASPSIATPAWVSGVSGGLAGLACWLASYPQDVIKSRLQTQSVFAPASSHYASRFGDGGFFVCAKQLTDSGGWRALWRGFGTCAVRAVWANAFGFICYETALHALRQNEIAKTLLRQSQ